MGEAQKAAGLYRLSPVQRSQGTVYNRPVTSSSAAAATQQHDTDHHGITRQPKYVLIFKIVIHKGRSGNRSSSADHPVIRQVHLEVASQPYVSQIRSDETVHKLRT